MVLYFYENGIFLPIFITIESCIRMKISFFIAFRIFFIKYSTIQIWNVFVCFFFAFSW